MKRRVTLTVEEHAELAQLLARGKADVGRLRHAQVLIKADTAGPALSDAGIAEALDVGVAMIERLRQRFVEEGLVAALSPYRGGRRICARKLDGDAEARLIARACSAPPEGRGRWTLRLLARQMVELGYGDRLSHETVRRALTKERAASAPAANVVHPRPAVGRVRLSHGGRARGLSPYDPRRPVVCLDETFKQPIGETRDPLPVRPGAAERFDHVYVRNGTASLFPACEPLVGWRQVAVTERRRRAEWAWFVRDLLDARYARAERIVLVMDQLNTHSAASFCDAFPPAEARRLAERLEIHHTPKHGSWLDIAEIEFSALARQRLACCIARADTLTRHIDQWQEARNAAATRVRWQFTTAHARIKLRSLYPSIEP